MNNQNPTQKDFLQPLNVIISLIASSPALGDINPDAFPRIYALVADKVGVQHAISQKTVHTFIDVLEISALIPFRPNAELIARHELEPILNASTNVKELVLHQLTYALNYSPHGLKKVCSVIQTTIDPSLSGAYERDSIVGCFLRKISLAFSWIEFDAFTKIWDDLRAFVTSPMQPSSSRKLKHTPNALESIEIQKAAVDLTKGMAVSHDEDFQEWLEMHQTSMEKEIATNVGFQSLEWIGKETESRTSQRTLENRRTHQSLDNLMHLEALRRKDFSLTLDSLHRFFDLSLIEVWKTNENVDPNDGANRTETFGHQYAALALGLVHANFGNHDLASISLSDAIRIAQNSSDAPCQSAALAWISRICTQSVSKRHQMLLDANDKQGLAREELTAVFTPVSADVPELVNICPPLGNSEGKPGSTIGRKSADRLKRIKSRLDYNARPSRVNSLLISSIAWKLHGASRTALAVAKLALQIAELQDEGRLSSAKARAVCAVASLTALEGDFVGAENLLKSHTPAVEVTDFPNLLSVSTAAPERHMLERSRIWLVFERALRRADIPVARICCESLAACADFAEGNEVKYLSEEFTLDALEARTRLELATPSVQTAVECANNYHSRALVFAQPARAIDGLRLLAEAHLRANTPDAALSPALSAASLSNGIGLESTHVNCVLTLTEVLLRRDEQDALGDELAIECLLPILPQAADGLGIRVRARALQLHAECLILRAQRKNHCPSKNVCDLLRSAIQDYQSVEDVYGVRDCTYILARVLHWCGNECERNGAATEFRIASEAIEKRKRAKVIRNELPGPLRVPIICE